MQLPRFWRALFLLLLLGGASSTALSQDMAPAPEITPPSFPANDSATPPPIPEQSPAAVDVAPTPAPTATPTPKPKSAISIEIDLQEQKAYLLHDGRRVYESPISSGRQDHLTPTGDFSVLEKDPNHFSNLYGQIVEKGSGRVMVSGADSSMPVPRGCMFKPAPMRFFMRFEGAAGMHAGILPGYAASHGCVRMPASKAKLFYNTAELGSEVHVFGKTPARAERSTRIVARVERAQPVPQAAPVRHGWWIFSR